MCKAIIVQCHELAFVRQQYRLNLVKARFFQYVHVIEFIMFHVFNVNQFSCICHIILIININILSSFKALKNSII